MSEFTSYYDDFASQSNRWSHSKNPTLCACRNGWFLSELDTWHQCPEHGEGKPHPDEDYWAEEETSVLDVEPADGRKVLDRESDLRCDHGVQAPHCGRCAGKGDIPQYRHVERGVCFRCLGSGKEPHGEQPATYTEKEAAVLTKRHGVPNPYSARLRGVCHLLVRQGVVEDDAEFEKFFIHAFYNELRRLEGADPEGPREALLGDAQRITENRVLCRAGDSAFAALVFSYGPWEASGEGFRGDLVYSRELILGSLPKESESLSLNAYLEMGRAEGKFSPGRGPVLNALVPEKSRPGHVVLRFTRGS